MASQSAFPLCEEVDREVSSETVGLEEAGDVVNALTSATARALVEQVYAEPATASELADAADTTLQNAQYHLDRLREAGVVEVVDTWYSERGNHMDVYGPTSEPLVIVAGPLDAEATLEEAMDESPAGDEVMDESPARNEATDDSPAGEDQSVPVRTDGGTGATARDRP
ncbi:MAG: ArsR/SmtB family transcription factor [Haloglomus sp.]